MSQVKMAIVASNKFSLLTFALLSVVLSFEEEDGSYGILMPNVHQNLPELFMCTAIKLDNSSEYYIVKFEPQARKDKIHHIVLYGCETPGSLKPLWDCSGPENAKVDKTMELASQCKSKPIILYAWAKGAPAVKLPPGVGFRVGGNTTIQYLAIQVHYAATNGKGHHHAHHHALTTDSTPVSSNKLPGLILHYTRRKMKLAGIFFLGAVGDIPPHSKGHWESACTIVEDNSIHPFAFRVHAHHLGTVVSGYRVRPDKNGQHHWKLIGKKNPQLPHMFYNVANNLTVSKGDTIAARCSYYNNRNYTVSAGSEDIDEMCNYYFMYYVDEGEPLQMRYCWTREGYDWSSDDLNNIPEDASAPE